jgi:hypothetical protein
MQHDKLQTHTQTHPTAALPSPHQSAHTGSNLPHQFLLAFAAAGLITACAAAAVQLLLALTVQCMAYV